MVETMTQLLPRSLLLFLTLNIIAVIPLVFAAPTPQDISTVDSEIPELNNTGGLPSCSNKPPAGTLPDNTCYPSIAVHNIAEPSAWGAFASPVESPEQALDLNALGVVDLSAWYQTACAQPISDICNKVGHYGSTEIDDQTPQWLFGINDPDASQACLVGVWLPMDNPVTFPDTDVCQGAILGPLLRVLQQGPTDPGRRVSVNLARWPTQPDAKELRRRTAVKVEVEDTGSGIDGSLTSWIIQPFKPTASGVEK